MLGVRADGSNEAFAQLVFFTLPPALAIGWLSCRFLEQPARMWAQRLVWRSRSAPAALGWQETHGHGGQRGQGAHQGFEGDHQHGEHEARAG